MKTTTRLVAALMTAFRMVTSPLRPSDIRGSDRFSGIG